MQSDDELASVIGHETGHIERRHVITTQSKAQILDILFGIASLFSPLIYNFGGLAEAGIDGQDLARRRASSRPLRPAADVARGLRSRIDGHHDGALGGTARRAQRSPNEVPRGPSRSQESASRTSWAIPNSIRKTSPTTQQLVQASSDEERARYEFGAVRLADILKKNPQDPEALLELGQSDLALGLTSKSQQTLSEAAQLGSPQTRAAANQRIAALRQMEVQRISLTRPNLPKLQSAVQAAQASQIEAATQIAARAAEGKDQIKSINTRVSTLQYEIPDFSRINIRRGSRVEAIVKNLTLMSRSIDSALQDARAPLGGVGTLEKGKESGLLKEGADIYTEMLEPFAAVPIPADSLAILPSYPQMLDDLSLANGDMLRSVDASRASLTLLDQSVGDLDEFLKELDHVQLGFNGDISEGAYSSHVPADAKVGGRLQRRCQRCIAGRPAL